MTFFTIFTVELAILTLSESMFFGTFTIFRKLVVIKLIFAIETQTVHQMKDIIHNYFLVESDFKITFEKVEKSVFENPIF